MVRASPRLRSAAAKAPTQPALPLSKITKPRGRPAAPKPAAQPTPIAVPAAHKILLPADPNPATLLASAVTHLTAVNPKLRALVAAHPCTPFTPAALAEPVDPFQALCSSIISQQVSGAAAKSIKGKFVALFEEQLRAERLGFPTPEMVLERTPAELRPAGLSARKAEYVLALARAFADRELTPELFRTGSDAEIVQRLTAVHGIGEWSAQMFLLFALRRPDVFAPGDLGVQRGFAALLGRDVEKLKRSGKGKWKYMKEEEMLREAEPYRPYRSVLCWYLWRVGDVGVDAFGEVGKEKKEGTEVVEKVKVGRKRKSEVDIVEKPVEGKAEVAKRTRKTVKPERTTVVGEPGETS